MSFEIVYEMERAVGGSPAWNSIKTFTRLSPNSAQFSGEINDVAGWFFRHTPCMHHRVSTFATVRGDPRCDSYLCDIAVGTQVKETARRRVPASNGLRWEFLDHNASTLQTNTVPIASVGSGGHARTFAISHVYQLEIADGVRTRLAESSIIGGLQIPPYHFVTLLLDVRRVQIKFDIDFTVFVTPRGCFHLQPDGSKQYTAFRSPFVIRLVPGALVVMEEPDWEREETATPEIQPREVTYAPPR